MISALLIVSILLVILYTGITIWRNRELPISISSMVYDLPRRSQWLWTVWVWAATYTLTPALFDIMPEDYGAVAHGFATAILFTGAMPLVRDEKNTAHNVLGITAGVFSQLCVLILNPVWLTVWMVMAFLCGSLYIQPQGWLAKAVDRKGVFIAEALCWLSLTGSLIFN